MMLRSRRSLWVVLGLLSLPYSPAAGQKIVILPPVAIISVNQLQQLIRQDSGNVVLVNAWASWCKPCLEELPGIVRMSREFSEKPFRIILVSLDDSDLASTAVKEALTNAGVNFQTYLVAGSGDEYFINKMSPKWSGALPTTFVYDRKGGLADMMVGKHSYPQFESSVKKLLKHQ